jgi:predicted acyl esterase
LGSDVSEWPLARTRFTDFYLHGAGALTTDPPREARCATTYQFDPARPVVHRRQRVIVARRAVAAPPGLADPSYAGRGERTADVMRPGGFDQREAPAPPRSEINWRRLIRSSRSDDLAKGDC